MAQLRSMGSGTDVLSMSAKSTRATLPHAAAPASYVSSAEAEKLVYAELDRQVKISNNAVYLLNGFLDQILYDILSKSQSTALGAVRAAIPLILKQRLGRAAIKAADEELQDYLEEDELENVQNHPAVLDPRAEFDVDLAWKLTRLRCMVYAKLGDMEEEDEEDYLDGDDVREHLSQVKEAYRSSARISPPSAIFLSTILEFVAEQALCIAAQHARKRVMYIKDPARETVPIQHHSDPNKIFLEEIDMSGIGKEGPLIRLWRSWKGNARTGGSLSSRPTTPNVTSPISPETPIQDWKFPSAPAIPPIQEEGSRSVTPANIPLPMTENDVDEIEVPGLARTFEEGETSEQRPGPGNRRPTSMLVMPGQFPSSANTDEQSQRPSPMRRRSRSLPPSTKASAGAQLATQAEPSPSCPVDGSKGDASALEGVGHEENPRSQEEEERSVLRSNAIGATVATIAGALNVEAAKAFRRERPGYELTSPDSHESSGGQGNAAEDFERTQGAVSTSAAGMDATEAESHEGTGDPEDLALSSSDADGGEAGNDHMNPRDSGFSVAGPAHAIPEDEEAAATDEAEPQATNQQDHEQVQGESGASNRNTRYSNLGYATIFQTPDTSSGYSNPNSTQSFVQGTARSNEAGANSITTTPSTTSTWPAVIPNRRSSLDRQKPENSHSEMRVPHMPPSYLTSEHEEAAENPQEFLPRYGTSALAAQSSRPISGSTKDGRPSTSGSGTARRQHIRLRSDNEEVWPREDLDRAKKSLDLLIDSNETLHYTLTPASANVGGKVKVKSQAQELAEFFRTTAPPGEEVRPKSSRSAKDGLRANPPQPPTPSQKSTASPAKPKNRLGEPREARMVRNNTRDLADYARSTGPEHEAQLPKLLSARPATAQTARTELSLREKVFGVDGENRPSTTSGKPSRLKYQARDARGPRTAESSDLIDFIREGPPRAPGEHRIDRSVAPFRTTMDSDDLNALAPPPELDTRGRNSDGSAQESAVTVKSMPSSMNSRTGLLESTNRAAGKFTNGFGTSSILISKQPVIPETDGMPKRTRPKIRDPYAIDYSDEEEEEEEMEEEYEPPKRRTDEESLVDFLRNTAPPPGMTTQPILAAMPNPTQPDPASMLRQSTSSSKLKDLLPGGSAASARPNQQAGGNNTTPNSRPVNIARAESPHLTQVGSRMDKYRPTTTTHAPHVERNRQKMRVQPRDATTNANGGGTADLAAYLMSSGPPPGLNDKPPQKIGGAVQKDQAGFLKFFQRRGSVRK